MGAFGIVAAGTDILAANVVLTATERMAKGATKKRRVVRKKTVQHKKRRR